MTCSGTVTCDVLAIRPACFDVIIQRGTDNQLEVVITDGEGRALDIIADTVTLTVKESRAGAAVFTKVNGPGGHSEPAFGKTVFDIDAADTLSASSTTPAYWVFDVRRAEAGGDERVHVRGDFVVEPTL